MKESKNSNNLSSIKNLYQNNTKKNSKEEIKDKDVFIKFFRKYVCKISILNTSLCFNKIKIRRNIEEVNKNNQNNTNICINIII